MSEPPPFVPLDQPLPLTPAESWIARALAAHAGPELAAQVQQACVVGRCSCGCSSVQLEARSEQLPAGQVEYLGVGATAVRSGDTAATAVLHVVRGVVRELELFDPELGEGHAVDPATVVALHGVELS